MCIDIAHSERGLIASTHTWFTAKTRPSKLCVFRILKQPPVTSVQTTMFRDGATGLLGVVVVRGSKGRFMGLS